MLMLALCSADDGGGGCRGETDDCRRRCNYRLRVDADADVDAMRCDARRWACQAISGWREGTRVPMGRMGGSVDGWMRKIKFRGAENLGLLFSTFAP